MTLSISLLRDRAAMLNRCRLFFQERGILEVDVCALQSRATIDAHIDPIPAYPTPSERAFLHTSPEYAMKRCLAAGSGDIFYLGHVFRQGEIGKLHAPEFTMAEWYRIGISLDSMIEETAAFLSLFLPERPLRRLRYREAFETYLEIDPSHAPISLLKTKAQGWALPTDTASWPRSTWLQFLLAHAIEPQLGRGEWTALTHYPPQEAALARVIFDGEEEVAERFEIYAEGIELCNGYHELPDPVVLRARFEKENRFRSEVGKESYLLDESFLAASIPDCCGVSVGIDRLMLLCHEKKALHEVLPFAWR